MVDLAAQISYNHYDYDDELLKNQQFINEILTKKYLINDEKIWNDVANRIQNTISNHVDSSQLKYITTMIRDQRFIPAGSILYGIGNNNVKVSLSNCYYIPVTHDSIEGIFKALAECAKVFAARGGSGTDLTILRPRGSKVSNASKTSTGAVSFMPLFSECVNTIGQMNRRGALLISLDIRHPDIIDFILSKSNPEQVFGKDSLTGRVPDIYGANISVKLTNTFMDAVKHDEEFALIFPDIEFEKYNTEWDGDYDKWINNGYPVIEYNKINARKILRQIAESAWICGDPGVLYIDNAIEWSSGYFDSKLKPFSSNPCGEQMLQRYGNCLLAAHVLHKYVKNPYTSNAEFDTETFLEDVKYGIIFLDTCIDINKHPLEILTATDQYGRRVGQEFTGLADMWSMLGMTYGSTEACDYLEGILQQKAITEIKTSLELAKIKGAAPCFSNKKKRQAFVNQPYIKRLFEKCLLPRNRTALKNEIIKYGLRNSAFNTVGPTGSISILADNCTSGIEPLYEFKYKRKTRLGKTVELFHYPILKHTNKEILKLSESEVLKKYNYILAHELNYKDRIKVQGLIQQYTDASISSTVNIPTTSTVDDIVNIYLEGHYNNLKGITVFRDKSKEGVLSSSENQHNTNSITNDSTIRRAYRFIEKWKGSKIYLTVTIDNKDKPIEVFATVPYQAGYDSNGDYNTGLYLERSGYWTLIGRLISLAFRNKVNVKDVISQLMKSTTTIVDLPAIILRVLSNFSQVDEQTIELIKSGKEQGEYCPSCNKYTVVMRGGCRQCLLCGDSKCG